MKSNLPLFLFPAWLLAAAACSEDPVPTTPDETPVEIVFSAGMDAAATEEDAAEAGTRTTLFHDGSGVQTEWKGSDDYPVDYDKVGIVVLPLTSTDLIEGSNNIPYKATTSGTRSTLVADGTSLSGLERGKVYRFLSYYPYDATQNFDGEVGSQFQYVFGERPDHRLEQELQTQAAPNDLSHLSRLMMMYARSVTIRISDSGTIPVVHFRYQHALSTLQMRITNKREEPVSVEMITLKNEWWQIGDKVDIMNGHQYTRAKTQTLEVTAPAVLTEGAEAQSFWLTLSRQFVGMCPSVEFTISTDKGDYVFMKPLPADGFSGGRNYTIDIAIPQTPGEGETWTPAS